MIRTPQVYFVQDRRGYVKIGYAVDPTRRLAGLQTANSGNLSIIRVVDGGKPTERWLHRRFAHCRGRGEWFDFDPAMLTVIPPDEIPSRATIKQKLRLTLKETLRNHDNYPLVAGDQPRLLATLLVSSFSDDDARDFLQWVRSRTHLPDQGGLITGEAA